jgi:hypothetical protein
MIEKVRSKAIFLAPIIIVEYLRARIIRVLALKTYYILILSIFGINLAFIEKHDPYQT